MIARPFRLSPALLLIWCLMANVTASAQTPEVSEVASWQVYGADYVYGQQLLVPGGGEIRVAPRAAPGNVWASGASMAIPFAIGSSTRVTGFFWARSARPTRIVATIQGGAPDYAVIVVAPIRVGPAWRRYAVSGVARGDLLAGSQSLTVQLGATTTAVSLGPVAFQLGERDDRALRRRFAEFRPAQIAQDVRIASDPGVLLAAMLRLPNRPAQAPFPVVILLGGGGPSPRGIYPLLEKRLLAEGIATLSYDKRGVGQSTGAFVDTLELMERDATAAVAFLRARGDIDGARIALLGLSQGGVVGPAIAAHDPRIAAVVMLGAPVGEKHGPFLDGMRTRLGAANVGKEAIEAILPVAGRFMEAQQPGTAPATLDAARQALVAAFVTAGFKPDEARGMTDFLHHPVLASMYQAAPADVLARVRAPVLAIYGGADSVVPSAGNLQQAQSILRGNPDATAIEVPRLGHSFQSIERDASGKPTHVGPPVSDPVVLDLILDWLGRRLRR